MEDEYKLRIAMNKIPVVHLNTTADFSAWHIALRRLVKSFGMGNALLKTIPRNQFKAFAKRKASRRRELHPEEEVDEPDEGDEVSGDEDENTMERLLIPSLPHQQCSSMSRMVSQRVTGKLICVQRFGPGLITHYQRAISNG